jgi:DNA polymerase-3 subunit delta
MQIRASELEAHLGKALAPAYAIHGDEPLIALEAADAVRAAARRRGFAERVVLEPGRSFDWSELTHAAASLSLFGGKKLIELRLPGGKPGAQGAAAIAAYVARRDSESLLLVSLPRLDRQTQSAAWFGALASAGVVVDVWPVERTRLPAWIAERLGRQQQRAPREVLEFLAERVEGNLLAAHQEVQKLALLAPPGELSFDTVEAAVVNVARFDPYDAA